uniref:CYP56D2 n=1 Tax=Danielia oregonensis TaxID=46584 RepID=A0A1B3B2L7_9ASCO|nr:CYP56D2 [[Candida] oregonensis]
MLLLTFFAEFEIEVCVALVVIVLAYQIRKVVIPPSDFPKNIPTIPFYVLLFGPFFDWDQQEIFDLHYREKLEKHGAVKVYFAQRWNILVTRPEFVSQLFRDDLIFEKTGNHVKIPHSVFSEFTGDNMISAGYKNWKVYRKIITDSILFPNLSPLTDNTKKLLEKLQKLTNGGETIIKVSDLLQRYTMANIGDCVIGVNFRTMDDGENVHVYEQLRRVKQMIFTPLFMMFPFLDRLPIACRKRAREAVHSFKKGYADQILEERCSENNNRVGPRLAESFEVGEITEKQFQDNSIMALLAGHENPQLVLTSLLYILAKHHSVQNKVRIELEHYNKESKLPYLTSVIYETIRLYPPIGQLINRRANRKVILGEGIVIPPLTYVGYNNFGTQRDRGVWGADADEFRPERWGTNEEEIASFYALSKSRCTFPAFHGRRRACLGEKFAIYELKLAVAVIIRNFHLSLDPNWKDKITRAGPICPVQLSIVFNNISKRVING